jgi:hypothetical protein
MDISLLIKRQIQKVQEGYIWRALHLIEGQIQEVQVGKGEHMTLLRNKSRRSRLGRESTSPC